MQKYILNTKTLQYEKYYWYRSNLSIQKRVLLLLAILALFITCLIQGTKYITTRKVVYVEKCQEDSLTVLNYYNYCKRIGIKYPKVVVAIAKIETNLGTIYQDPSFSIDNNYLCMMVNDRGYSCQGKKKDFACYDSWKFSLHDFKELQYKYYWDCKTEQQFINQVCKNYSNPKVDKGYREALVNALKQVKNQLKD